MLAVWYFLSHMSSDGNYNSSTKKKLFSKSNYVGVIEINGAIMDSKKWLEQIENFEEDALIKGVVIRINSPGGAVAPSQEVHDAVKRLSDKKPVVASFGNIAASGGYYIGVAAKKIYSNPGTITASIGVIMQFADFSKLFQWAKVNPYVIKTGKYKDIGSPNREMNAEEKELLSGMANNVLAQFRKAVAEGRNMPMEKVVEISDGRIMSGEQAKDAGLVDELGGLKEAVTAVAKEANISGKPHVVYASKKKKFLEKLFMNDEDDYDSESSTQKFNWFSKLVGFLFMMSNSEKTNMFEDSSLKTFSGPMYLLPTGSE